MSKPMRFAMGGGGSLRSAMARRNAAPAIENASLPTGAGSCQVTMRVRSLTLTLEDLLPQNARALMHTLGSRFCAQPAYLADELENPVPLRRRGSHDPLCREREPARIARRHPHRGGF